MADWDKSEHPRHPAGDDHGGEFRDKTGGWVAAIAGRLPGAKLPEMKPTIGVEYGDAVNEETIQELSDGSTLRLLTHPSQEVAVFALVSPDGESIGHMADYTAQSLRNTYNLWNAVDMMLLPYDLQPIAEENGLHADGALLQVRLSDGEGFAMLPEGGMRWYPPGNYPPVDFENRQQGQDAMRKFEELAGTLESDIDDYLEEDDDDDEEYEDEDEEE